MSDKDFRLMELSTVLIAGQCLEASEIREFIDLLEDTIDYSFDGGDEESVEQANDFLYSFAKENVSEVVSALFNEVKRLRKTK